MSYANERTEWEESYQDLSAFYFRTPLDQACALLASHSIPAIAKLIAPEHAFGCFSAETVLTESPLPPTSIALCTGFATSSSETVGASPYTPYFSFSSLKPVACGDPLQPPDDAVLPPPAINTQTFPAEILMQLAPGENVRRAGGDLNAGSVIIEAGERIRSFHLPLLRAAGIDTVSVRTPRILFLVDNDLQQGAALTAFFLQVAREYGMVADVSVMALSDGSAVRTLLASVDTEIIICLGMKDCAHGNGIADALKESGLSFVSGLALNPGETGGCGFLQTSNEPCPIIFLPERFEAALAVWLALVRPCLMTLATSRVVPFKLSLPLTRKIVSAPGMADMVLLRRMFSDNKLFWEPLACGDLAWSAIARAEAFFIIPAQNEGYCAGEMIAAEIL